MRLAEDMPQQRERRKTGDEVKGWRNLEASWRTHHSKEREEDQRRGEW